MKHKDQTSAVNFVEDHSSAWQYFILISSDNDYGVWDFLFTLAKIMAAKGVKQEGWAELWS